MEQLRFDKEDLEPEDTPTFVVVVRYCQPNEHPEEVQVQTGTRADCLSFVKELRQAMRKSSAGNFVTIDYRDKEGNPSTSEWVKPEDIRRIKIVPQDQCTSPFGSIPDFYPERM